MNIPITERLNHIIPFKESYQGTFQSLIDQNPPYSEFSVYGRVAQICSLIHDLPVTITDWGIDRNEEQVVDVMTLPNLEESVVHQIFSRGYTKKIGDIANPVIESQMPAKLAELRSISREDQDPYYAITPYHFSDWFINVLDLQITDYLLVNSAGVNLPLRVSRFKEENDLYAPTVFENINDSDGDLYRPATIKQFRRQLGYDLHFHSRKLDGARAFVNQHGLVQEDLIKYEFTPDYPDDHLILDTQVFFMFMNYANVTLPYHLTHQESLLDHKKNAVSQEMAEMLSLMQLAGISKPAQSIFRPAPNMTWPLD